MRRRAPGFALTFGMGHDRSIAVQKGVLAAKPEYARAGVNDEV
jgi:hypothetical protein